MKTIPTKSATFLRMMAALVAPMLLTIAPLLGQEPVDARQMFDGAMRPRDAVNTLENSDRLFPVREIKRGGSVRALPVSKMPLQNVRFEVNGKHYDLYDYLALNRVAGLLVLKNGEIALEDYELGAGTQTRWASFSMGKSWPGNIPRILLKRGQWWMRLHRK